MAMGLLGLHKGTAREQFNLLSKNSLPVGQPVLQSFGVCHCLCHDFLHLFEHLQEFQTIGLSGRRWRVEEKAVEVRGR